MTSTAPGPRWRAVRAAVPDGDVIVYQAYTAAIADAALAAGTFVAPFRRGRMTWIKPSFLWMAYRSGWARKPDQERVLAVRITTSGLSWALSHACLATYERDVHGSERAWKASLADSPVRVQWDPERDLDLAPLDHRAIQIGLRGEAVDRYLDEWIVGIEDVTARMHEVSGLVAARDLDAARGRLPVEQVVEVGADIEARLGMARSA